MEKSEEEEVRIRKCIKGIWKEDFDLLHVQGRFPDSIDVTVKVHRHLSRSDDWITIYREGAFKIFEGLKDIYEDVECEVKFREPPKIRVVWERETEKEDEKPLGFRVNLSTWTIRDCSV
jgi:hypothetical protein